MWDGPSRNCARLFSSNVCVFFRRLLSFEQEEIAVFPGEPERALADDGQFEVRNAEWRTGPIARLYFDCGSHRNSLALETAGDSAMKKKWR